MKLRAIHLLVIMLLALLGCSIFTCKMIEGLTNKKGGSDTPVDPETLQPLPYSPLATSRPMPSAMPAPIDLEMKMMGPGGALSAPAGQFGTDMPGPGLTFPNVAPASSALPKGIPASEIPDGDEDLYIRKSEIVPPVCPACPSVSECPRQAPCPPCPACARCPEPAFECKKVPNYSADVASGHSAFLPRPVLTDFSQFGM